jgi:hypothetical protein
MVEGIPVTSVKWTLYLLPAEEIVRVPFSIDISTLDRDKPKKTRLLRGGDRAAKPKKKFRGSRNSQD